MNHTRFNALARLSQLFDQRPSVPAAVESRDSTIFSLDTSFQVNPRLEWVTRTALRTDERRGSASGTTESTTGLAIQRLNLSIRQPFELGMEYRILKQDEADDARQGWLGEFSWRLQRHFRVGVGYNFTDFADDAVPDNDYSVQGWFLRVQGIY